MCFHMKNESRTFLRKTCAEDISLISIYPLRLEQPLPLSLLLTRMIYEFKVTQYIISMTTDILHPFRFSLT